MKNSSIRITIYYLFLFLLIGIIFVFLYNYVNKSHTNTNTNTHDCESCGKKEGMTNYIQGGMRGTIKRHIHPIRRHIRDNFKNPTAEYYYNKLEQLFR